MIYGGEVLDYYKTYIAVHDYEESLQDYTLAILAKLSRGKTFEQWKDPKFICGLEEKVSDELRETVTDKWGFKVSKVYITDNVPCYVNKLTHDGQPISINNKTTLTGNSGSPGLF